MNKIINYIKNSSVIMRFLRGFAASFVATALTVAIPNIKSIPELGNWVYVLLIAGVMGGITGGLLALDKYFRMNQTPETPTPPSDAPSQQ